MKAILLAVFVFMQATLLAQLSINQGALLTAAGNAQITLQNTDLVNNGNFVGGTGSVLFSGNADVVISGSQPVLFHEIELAKTNDRSVSLQTSITVSQRILFTNGFLNLNGFNADLGTTAHLDGETDASCITGANGGEVVFNTHLNAPVHSNPANLRLFITSARDLGNVTIRRGHQSQAGFGLSKSILRYYSITAQNNTTLDATLQFNYLDRELNGLTEADLTMFDKESGNFASLDVVSKDALTNFVEAANISSFGRFTLSANNNVVLPVQFVSFNANCEDGKLVLRWKTAQEANTSRFEVERSIDGNHFTVIGSSPPVGNAGGGSVYSFTDNKPLQNALYRIAEVDRDNKQQYSAVVYSACNTADVLTLSPNPAHSKVFIDIVAAANSTVDIKLFDSKGALVKQQSGSLVPGSNVLHVDVSAFRSGLYHVSAVWKNGSVQKNVQLIKQ